MFEALATKHSCPLPYWLLVPSIIHLYHACNGEYVFIHVLHRRFTAPLALSSMRMDDCTIKIQVVFPDNLRTIMASGSRLAFAFINIRSRMTERFDPKMCHTNSNTGSWVFFPWVPPNKTHQVSQFNRSNTRTRHWPKRRAWWLVVTHGVMPSRYLNAEAVPPVVPRTFIFWSRENWVVSWCFMILWFKHVQNQWTSGRFGMASPNFDQILRIRTCFKSGSLPKTQEMWPAITDVDGTTSDGFTNDLQELRYSTNKDREWCSSSADICFFYISRFVEPIVMT